MSSVFCWGTNKAEDRNEDENYIAVVQDQRCPAIRSFRVENYSLNTLPEDTFPKGSRSLDLRNSHRVQFYCRCWRKFLSVLVVPSLASVVSYSGIHEILDIS